MQTASVTSLRGTLSLFGYTASEQAYISTFNLQARLETVVRHPNQNGTASQSRPRLSPDGAKIVYAETGEDGFNTDVYVMDVDGSNRVNLSNFPADPAAIYNCRFADPSTGTRNSARCRDTSPAWSPDGRHIAFISGRGGRDELYLMNADGTNQTLLPSKLSAAPNDERGFYGQPSWSPDGSKIVYSYGTDYPPYFDPRAQQTEIAVLTLERQEAEGNVTFSVTSDVQLTENPVFDLAPAWSPDGSKIAFHRYDPNLFPHGNDNSDLYVMNADGSNQVNLTSTTDRHETLPVWSPAGSQLAFTLELFDPECRNGCFGIGETQLVVLDLNSSSLTRIETSFPTVHAYSWVDLEKVTGDLLFKKDDEAFAGDDVYQTAPGGAQLRSDELAAGVPLKYTVKLQNDRAAAATAFRLRTGTPVANAGWSFRLKHGETDISAAARSAEGWKTPDLPTQEEIVLTLEAEPNTPAADEAAELRVTIALDEEPNTVVDALGINIERSDVIVVNETGDAVDPTPEDGSPDVDPAAEGAQITLRSAINFSNRKPTRDTIEFNVPRSPLPLIKPTAALPPVTAPTVLAGDSSGGGKVELDGSSAGESDGLTIQSDDCVIRGFVIHSFFKNGIEIGGAGSNVVQGCRIGTDVTGSIRRTNRMSGIHITSPRNTIGGSTGELGTAPGNLIAGNGVGEFNGINAGIFIDGAQADENVVAGNLIGTDVTGANALGNEEIGVTILEGADNRVGGSTEQERNIISGNTKAGIVISGGNATKNRVLGNYIGTDLAGTGEISNGQVAIQIEGGAFENSIGGTASASRNVIGGAGDKTSSGVVHAGVQISSGARKNSVHGNYIGTDATGEKALGAHVGVLLAGGARENLIGGYSPGARNVISGNLFAGISLGSDGGGSDPFSGALGIPNAGNIVAGNFIGTNKSGTAPLPNGTSSDGPRAGVLVAKGSGSFILGGIDGTARNVISGNQGAGVLFTGGDSAQRAVFANYIGLRPDGQGPLPNDGPGVWVRGGNSNVAIGAVQGGAPNRVAFNRGPGVFVEDGTKILVFGNQIFGNDGLAIDLGTPGPSLNDPRDADSGPNLLQNFPVLETVTRTEQGSRIQGRLDSRGAEGDIFGIAFYTSPEPHPSGAGEGETFIGYATVPADPSGVIAFDITLPAVITPGLLLTATATDKDSNTSEFGVAGVVEGKTDRDSDGISDDLENQVPNRAGSDQSRQRRGRAVKAHGFGDGNGDGILDSEQMTVSSFVGSTGKWLTLVVPEGTRLAAARAMRTSDFDNLPGGYVFEAGFVNFTVTGVQTGGAIVVSQIFHDATRYSTLLAHGPAPGQPAPHWFQFRFDGTTGGEFRGDELVLHLVDGGRGDSDGLANGQITATIGPASRGLQLLNIATRLRVQSGENVLIGGLIVTGSDAKRVIIRAIGPSLSQAFDGALADPVLELYQGETLVAANDNWKDNQQTEIEATTIPPGHDLESAIVQTLAPGFYTAVLSGRDGASGIAVVEAYDLDVSANSQLANIASRGLVEAGENVMIGGLIVGGNGSENARVLVRAIGPSLRNSGVAGALEDPTLELRDNNGELVRDNDNWQDSQPAEIEATSIPPADPAESAIIAALPPGNYTAVVRGKNDGTGVGLVEVYDVD